MSSADPRAPRRVDPDLAALYHLHSSNERARSVDFDADEDRHPFRCRTYPGAVRVALPGRDLVGLDAPLGGLLADRRSERAFTTTASLPLATLGRLLFASYGVRGVRAADDGQHIHDRSVPSAGGLYPLELYVAVQRVEDVADGVYHYDAVAHALELRAPGSQHARMAEMTVGQSMLANAHAVVVVAAVFERTMWKYKQRGYRYVWLEAGHVGQNLYLVANSLGLGAVAVGGFYDAELRTLLALPAGEEVTYLVAAGVRATT